MARSPNPDPPLPRQPLRAVDRYRSATSGAHAREVSWRYPPTRCYAPKDHPDELHRTRARPRRCTRSRRAGGPDPYDAPPEALRAPPPRRLPLAPCTRRAGLRARARCGATRLAVAALPDRSRRAAPNPGGSRRFGALTLTRRVRVRVRSGRSTRRPVAGYAGRYLLPPRASLLPAARRILPHYSASGRSCPPGKGKESFPSPLATRQAVPKLPVSA